MSKQNETLICCKYESVVSAGEDEQLMKFCEVGVNFHWTKSSTAHFYVWQKCVMELVLNHDILGNQLLFRPVPLKDEALVHTEAIAEPEVIYNLISGHITIINDKTIHFHAVDKKPIAIQFRCADVMRNWFEVMKSAIDSANSKFMTSISENPVAEGEQRAATGTKSHTPSTVVKTITTQKEAGFTQHLMSGEEANVGSQVKLNLNHQIEDTEADTDIIPTDTHKQSDKFSTIFSRLPKLALYGIIAMTKGVDLSLCVISFLLVSLPLKIVDMGARIFWFYMRAVNRVLSFFHEKLLSVVKRCGQMLMQ